MKTSSDVDIATLRILISLIRQAERDYLALRGRKKLRRDAWASLFGIRFSPLNDVCKALNLDPLAVRLRLILWKARGMNGDPMFDWLRDRKNLDRHEMGLQISWPTLRSVIDECGSDAPNRPGSSGIGPETNR